MEPSSFQPITLQPCAHEVSEEVAREISNTTDKKCSICFKQVEMFQTISSNVYAMKPIRKDDIIIPVRLYDVTSKMFCIIKMRPDYKIAIIINIVHVSLRVKPECILLTCNGMLLSPFAYFSSCFSSRCTIEVHKVHVNRWKAKAITAPLLWERAMDQSENPKNKLEVPKRFRNLYKVALDTTIKDEIERFNREEITDKAL